MDPSLQVLEVSCDWEQFWSPPQLLPCVWVQCIDPPRPPEHHNLVANWSGSPVEFGSTMDYTCTTSSHHYEEDYSGTFYTGARCLEGGGWEVVAPWPTCLTSRCPHTTLLQV